MSVLIPRVLFQDERSVIYRCDRVLDKSEREILERDVRAWLGRQPVEIHFHTVDREATIVVGHVRDSR